MREFSDYDAYWAERGDLRWVFERWRIAAEVIPDGASVLDVGCGTGEFIAYLREQRPHVDATGCDLSARAVQMTVERGVDAFVADLAMEDLDGKYDYVTCFEVLEHIPDAETALERLKAVARHQIIASVPNAGYLDNRLRLALFGRFPITNCIFHIKEHVRHWTKRDFVEWVGHFGLRVVRVAPQYPGIRFLPWRRYPGLLSAGLVYVLERAEASDGGLEQGRRARLTTSPAA